MRSLRDLMMLGLLATAVRAQAPPQTPPPAPPPAQPECQTGVCAAAYRPAVDGPPRIDRKRSCPRPICNACDLPQGSNYDKCWTPWPFPPHWTNGSPPPALATPNPLVNLNRPSHPGK